MYLKILLLTLVKTFCWAFKSILLVAGPHRMFNCAGNTKIPFPAIQIWCYATGLAVSASSCCRWLRQQRTSLAKALRVCDFVTQALHFIFEVQICVNYIYGVILVSHELFWGVNIQNWTFKGRGLLWGDGSFWSQLKQ